MGGPCASFYGVHWVLTPSLLRLIFGAVQTNPMNDFDTIDTDLWHEIMETPGEIFDIPEMQDVMVDFQQALNSDEDF